MESLGLVFRALVMLACLAVVPLLALYGKFLPDIVQTVVEAVKSRGHSDATASPYAAGGEAPAFAGSPSPRNGGRSIASGDGTVIAGRSSVLRTRSSRGRNPRETERRTRRWRKAICGVFSAGRWRRCRRSSAKLSSWRISAG